MLEKEKIILDEYIVSQGLKILHEFPKDSIFESNEFLLLNNGVYINIIDYGDRKQATSGTIILTTAKGYFLNAEFSPFNGFDQKQNNVIWPLKFKYGETSFSDNDFLSIGYSAVLQHVGNNSIVSMIVPSTIGSYKQNIEAVTIYFEKVIFSF